MGRKNEWTTLEIRLLEKHYPDVDHCCTVLKNRSRNAIKAMAGKLGLSNPAWSANELSVLRKFYEPYGAEYCHQKIKRRSVISIRSQAQKIGLKRHTAALWSDTEIDILKTHYKLIGATKIKKLFLPDRSVKSIQAKASELDLIFEFWPAEKVDFLKKNYLTMSYRDLGNHIGKNEKSVSNKIRALQLKLKKGT